MLRSIKQLYGEKLRASEGDIGHVKDFYFDDQKWAIRYVVVDTGSWISGRLVLLAPHAFGGLHRDGKVLLVNLTRQQIENSPLIETSLLVKLRATPILESFWDVRKPVRYAAKPISAG